MSGRVGGRCALDGSASLTNSARAFRVTLSNGGTLSTGGRRTLSGSLDRTFGGGGLRLCGSGSIDPAVTNSFFTGDVITILVATILIMVCMNVHFGGVNNISTTLATLLTLMFSILVAFFAYIVFNLRVSSGCVTIILAVLNCSLGSAVIVCSHVHRGRHCGPSVRVNRLIGLDIGGIVMHGVIAAIAAVLTIAAVIIMSRVCNLADLHAFTVPVLFNLVSNDLSSLFVSKPI